MTQYPITHTKSYEMYLGRLIREYNLVWQRFKVFSVMNTSLLIALSLLLVFYQVKNLADIANNDELHLFMNLFSAVGIIISISWTMINWGSVQWMNLMTEFLGDMEKEIFPEPAPELYAKIASNQSRSEIIVVNIGLSVVFIGIWCFVLFALTLI